MQIDPSKKSPAEKRSFIRSIAEQAMQARLDALYLAALALADPNAPTPPIDKKELKRRATFLASRAYPAPYGRVVCPFCGNLKGEGGIRNHIRNCHALDVIEMPAERFA
jgi:hypothetical protein